VKYGKLSSCRTLSKHDDCFFPGSALPPTIKCFKFAFGLCRVGIYPILTDDFMYIVQNYCNVKFFKYFILQFLKLI
jgi:hypothetical protein